MAVKLEPMERWVSGPVQIHAWRTYNDGETTGVVACAYNDERATRFDVHYPGEYCHMGLEFTDRYKAEQTARALVKTFEAGKGQAFADLRNFIGVHA